MFLLLTTTIVLAQEDTSTGNCLLASCDKKIEKTELSVLNQPLIPCSANPLTGYFRDSYCRTGPSDVGFHVVCAEVNNAFLAYTKSMGNDLSTPSRYSSFPGLKPGDRWCLCASRWKQAEMAGYKTKVILEATNLKALETLKLIDLVN